MHKLICLNAYSLRDTAFSIVFKSYHLTLKVNVKGSGESCHPFSISPFQYFFETDNFKLVLYLYVGQMILMFGHFVFLSKRKKPIYRNAKETLISVTATTPQLEKNRRKPPSKVSAMGQF